MIRAALLAGVICVIGLAGCDNRGPAQRAGEKLDETADTIKHGGHESVTNSVKDDVHKAQDNVQDASKDAQDKPHDR